MPTLLSDPPLAVYAILGVIVLVLGVLAARRQRRADGLTFLAGLAVLLALLVCDWRFDSPRESVARTLKEMEAASQSRKYDDLFQHVSDKFDYRGHNKKSMREKAAQAEPYVSEGFRFWNVSRANFRQLSDTRAEQEFDVQVIGNPATRRVCVGVFELEADGQWRMTTFRIYPVVNNGPDRQEEVPPGL
jgi:hypothetical protein